MSEMVANETSAASAEARQKSPEGTIATSRQIDNKLAINLQEKCKFLKEPLIDCNIPFLLKTYILNYYTL